MIEILPILLGGLVLFLYAISQLSEVLKGLFSSRAQRVITRYTRNIYSGILIGTVLTIMLDSSSAVIIMVIVLINAQVLSLKEAFGIIMGANIGTTFSSQIIALNIAQYSVIPLAIGLILEIFARDRKLVRFGKISLYFGMLFFGLYIMEQSVLPLRDSEVFNDWITRIEGNHIYGALIGGLITLIIQSSSGTVGMAIILGKQGLLSIAGGIAIMLGAELGTCSDTLLATIRGRRQAIKAGVFHLFFNFATIILGLLLFTPFMTLVQLISGSQDIGHQIANAHVLFNVAGVVIFLPFVPLAERLLNRWIPEKELPSL